MNFSRLEIEIIIKDMPKKRFLDHCLLFSVPIMHSIR